MFKSPNYLCIHELLQINRYLPVSTVWPKFTAWLSTIFWGLELVASFYKQPQASLSFNGWLELSLVFLSSLAWLYFKLRPFPRLPNMKHWIHSCSKKVSIVEWRNILGCGQTHINRRKKWNWRKKACHIADWAQAPLRSLHVCLFFFPTRRSVCEWLFCCVMSHSKACEHK